MAVYPILQTLCLQRPSAQHLAMAALRVVENRAYLIRAANTGISAIVPPDGRIAQASGLFTRVALSGAIIPQTGGGFYTRHGDLLAWGTVGLASAVVLTALTVCLFPRRARKLGLGGCPKG
jgi:apolipoprotein N-acyltransferase